MREPCGPRIFDSSWSGYFFAGVLWVVLTPERTEWSPLERESMTVRPMELSMKMTADQVVSFIRSSVQLHHDDAKVAEYVKKIKLSEIFSGNT